MAKMFEGYDSNQFQRSQSGLYLPYSPTMREVAVRSQEIEKARMNGTATDYDEQLQRKMGTLFSLYSQIYTNAVSWGASEKPVGTATHRMLRETAKQSLIDSLIINARLYQVRHVAHRVVVEGKQKGLKVRHKRHSDSTFKMRPQMEEICREIEDMIFSPNKEVHPSGIADVLVKYTQGQLVIDRVVMVIVRDRRNRPLSYHLLPPDDIKPRLQVLLQHMPSVNQQRLDNYRRQPSAQDFETAMSTIYDKFGVDVSTAQYVQEIDGVVMGAWGAGEIAVEVTSPSDELNMQGYGISSLERSLEATTLLLLALNYNKGTFLQSYPEAFLILKGDVDPVGLAALKAQMFASVGPQGNQRLPVFSTGDSQFNGAELLKLRDTPREMEMPQMIRLMSALKASSYRAHPKLINLNADQGKQRAVIANQNDAFDVDLAQEEGLGSLLENFCSWLTRELIEPVEEWADYELVPVLDPILGEKELEEIWEIRLQNGRTVDEYRAAVGAEPLAKVTNGLSDGGYVNNQFFFQAAQLQQQAIQAQLQQMFPQQNGNGANGNGKPGEVMPKGEQGFSGMEQQQEDAA